MEFCISCGTPTKKGFHVCDKCMFGMGKNVPKIKLEVSVDKNLYTRFRTMTKDCPTDDSAFEKVMTSFINQMNNKGGNVNIIKSTIGKIKQWSTKPDGDAHRIIKAYFAAEHFYKNPLHSRMERLCSNENEKRFYVRNFLTSYNNMKSNSKLADAKIFKKEGEFGLVQIWDEYKDTLMEYKKLFFNETKDLPKNLPPFIL